MEPYLYVEIAALIFWSFQLAPQAYSNWMRQSTEGLSSLMMLSWTLGSLATAIYCIGGNVGGDVSPIFIAQPNVFMVFSILCCTQCIAHNWKSRWIGIVAGIILVFLIAVVEVLGGYYLLQNPSPNGLFALGLLSLIFFAVGFVPQYKQIYDEKRVSGISLLFLSIDMTGSVLSIAALALQDNFDPISAACYLVVFVCDFGILLLYYVHPLVFDTAITRISDNVDENGIIVELG